MNYATLMLGLLTLLAGCDNFSAAASGGVSRAEAGLVNLSRNIREVNAFNAQAWARTACLAPYGQVVNPPPESPGYAAAVVDLCGVPMGLMRIPGFYGASR